MPTPQPPNTPPGNDEDEPDRIEIVQNTSNDEEEALEAEEDQNIELAYDPNRSRKKGKLRQKAKDQSTDQTANPTGDSGSLDWARIGKYAGDAGISSLVSLEEDAKSLLGPKKNKNDAKADKSSEGLDSQAKEENKEVAGAEREQEKTEADGDDPNLGQQLENAENELNDLSQDGSALPEANANTNPAIVPMRDIPTETKRASQPRRTPATTPEPQKPRTRGGPRH